MGEPEIRAENKTTAPTENFGAGPQAAGTNTVVQYTDSISSLLVLLMFKAEDCFMFFLQVYSRPSRVTTAGSLFKGDTQEDKSSLKNLYDCFRQTIEDMTTQV